MIFVEVQWKNTDVSFKSKVIGKLLGDGSITKQKSRKSRFQFMHVATDYNWCNYCYLELSSELPLNPPKHKKINDSRLLSGYSESYYVQSRTSEIITYLHAKWYPFDSKILPFDLINSYFDLQSLAWWYMDDGHLKVENGIPRKVIFSTDSFSKHENNMLIDLLYNRYHLKFRLDKQNRLILYDQFQIHHFLYLVTPFLHASMYRKFLHSYSLINDFPAKRTTIHLPSSIKIQYPTKQINKTLKQLDKLILDYKNDNFFGNYLIGSDYNVETKPYQIIIEKENFSKLQFLFKLTGLNYSKLVNICFELL